LNLNAYLGDCVFSPGKESVVRNSLPCRGAFFFFSFLAFLFVLIEYSQMLTIG